MPDRNKVSALVVESLVGWSTCSDLVDGRFLSLEPRQHLGAVGIVEGLRVGASSSFHHFESCFISCTTCTRPVGVVVAGVGRDGRAQRRLPTAAGKRRRSTVLERTVSGSVDVVNVVHRCAPVPLARARTLRRLARVQDVALRVRVLWTGRLLSNRARHLVYDLWSVWM